jgi:hypothetical protein
MNNFPSCFRRGGKPANGRSPFAPFPGRAAPMLCDHRVEVLRARPWRFIVMPAGKGFMQVGLNKSSTAEAKHEEVHQSRCFGAGT